MVNVDLHTASCFDAQQRSQMLPEDLRVNLLRCRACFYCFARNM
jgi:hypothetical protein